VDDARVNFSEPPSHPISFARPVHLPVNPAAMLYSTKQQVLFYLFAVIALFAQFHVAAADAGDVLAGLIGSFAAVFVICAIIGWCSRRGQNTSSSSNEEDGN